MKKADPKEFPCATLIHDYESDSEEWHKARANGIGGSEIGTILGLNPWESAYALWAKKSGLIEDSIKENWAIRLGKAFEEPILKLFQQEHPELEVYRASTYASVEHPVLLANPDALAYNPATKEWIVIEIKTARYPWTDVPPHYQAQVQHYMYVMGIKRAYVVALAGMDYKEYEMEADEFQQHVQIDAAKRFWDSLTNGVKPDWDGSESTYQAVRSQHPMIDDTEVDLGDLGMYLFLAQTKVDEAEEELRKLKSMTLDNMGYAKTGYVEVEGGEKMKVASRQIRGGMPTLIIHRSKS